MPELPDIVVYAEALAERIVGQPLNAIRLINPFLLRTAVPPLESTFGRKVLGTSRLGKRIVVILDGELFLVMHLMIAGRLRWLALDAKLPGRITQAVFDFPTGQLAFTEAGTKRRASLHVVEGKAALAAHDPGGIDVMEATLAAFAAGLTAENHTLKRVLTDPRVFSGIGNAYSDEILHRAQLSPIAHSQKLSAAEIERLHAATKSLLMEWTARLRKEAKEKFPEKVTAFRDDFAVHGKFKQPCPVCGAPVQRIVYADNETNYCARCQTGGVVLADRALSRLLKKSWPRSIDELG
ncbi:MAG: DNA-formamidopyrimidine glycosylase family protein [Betaproteobacteria bacterium]